MAGIYSPFQPLCPFCNREIKLSFPANDENGELAIHIREGHPEKGKTDWLAEYRRLNSKYYPKSPLPENIVEAISPAVSQDLIQGIATKEGLKRFKRGKGE